MKRELKNLLKHRTNYNIAIDIMKDKIRQVCDFDADIEYLYGEGYCIVNMDTTAVSPIGNFTQYSKTKSLTAEEHQKLSI